jgi:hypothetical protein
VSSRQKPRFLPAAHELAEGLDSAKIPAEDRHAGKNHAFCRPRMGWPGLDSAKIPAGNFRQ